jgi:two-component system response regulator
MHELKPILLAEDDPSDAELTIEALADNKLANRVTLVRDGVAAMEYLRRKG